jgi:hypothetical protein
MPSDGEDIIQTFRSQIEGRVREQLRRHHNVDPNIDPKRIIDIQIAQEKERLEKMYDRLDTKSHDLIDSLIEWLPDLANELSRR